MPIIRKNVLFHSYPILSRKIVISFHSCFKFFETGATPPIYFQCSYSKRVLYYIWFVEVERVMTVCVFKVFPLLLLCVKATISLSLYLSIYIVTAGKIMASVFVFFTGTLWSKSGMTEENSSDLEAFGPRQKVFGMSDRLWLFCQATERFVT